MSYVDANPIMLVSYITVNVAVSSPKYLDLLFSTNGMYHNIDSELILLGSYNPV